MRAIVPGRSWQVAFQLLDFQLLVNAAMIIWLHNLSPLRMRRHLFASINSEWTKNVLIVPKLACAACSLTFLTDWIVSAVKARAWKIQNQRSGVGRNVRRALLTGQGLADLESLENRYDCPSTDSFDCRLRSPKWSRSLRTLCPERFCRFRSDLKRRLKRPQQFLIVTRFKFTSNVLVCIERINLK